MTSLAAPANPVLSSQRKRLQSIDIVRGIIMLLMLLDHSRNFWTEGNGIDPLNLSQTYPALFFTRWITHFCAPLFVLLTGVSAYLTKHNRGQTARAAAWALASRGLWLIILELTIVSALWGMVFFLNGIQLQVIWAIGISLLFLSVVQFLPARWVGLIGLVIVLGHNLIPDLASDNSLGRLAWSLFHQSNFFSFGQYQVIALYPAVPWIGVMALGYAMGELFTRPPASRRKFLVIAGLSALALFVVLRCINLYGDPHPFQLRGGWLFSLMDFINLEKYPPSLQFLLITLGPGCLALAALDAASWNERHPLVVFGRTPLFFYLVHLALLIVAIVAWLGFNWLTKIGQPAIPLAYALPVAYLVWLILVLPLYGLCRWYYRVKFNGKPRWWTYYL